MSQLFLGNRNSFFARRSAVTPRGELPVNPSERLGPQTNARSKLYFKILNFPSFVQSPTFTLVSPRNPPCLSLLSLSTPPPFAPVPAPIYTPAAQQSANAGPSKTQKALFPTPTSSPLLPPTRTSHSRPRIRSVSTLMRYNNIAWRA